VQFEDARKKYEIVFDHIQNKGHGSYPQFKMIMEKPVKGEARFEVTDIKTQSGHTGINISQYSEIAKALKSKGKDVLIVVAPEALEFVRKTHDEERNKVIEEAKNDPETWIWWSGCDTGRMYISPNTELGWEFRPDLEKVKAVLEKEHYTAPDIFFTETRTETHCVVVPHDVVMAEYNRIIEKKNAKKAAKQAEKDTIFQKAKETGEKQIIETYSVECSDPDEECDVDIVTVYAMPDGTTKTTQNHTW
jgi:hypothetical protein